MRAVSSRVVRPVLLTGALLVVILALLTAPASGQEELPVKIRADNFRYDRRTKVLTATGNVVLTAEDVVIHADALVANLDTGAVTAEGHVRLNVRGQSVSADVLTYNLNTRLGELLSARTEYTGPLVLGSIKLRAQRMEGILDRFVGIKDGFATTCDETDPVFHITAEEITVFVNDKIVGRGVSIWVAGRKIVTLPYFLIFLRERRESRLSPVIGYTEAEGLFVKTRYSYFLNENRYGFILWDWFQRLGIGLGVEHFYHLRGGQGSLLLYRLGNTQTGGADTHAILNHAQELGDVKARLYADYRGHSFAAAAPTSMLFTALDVSRATPQASTFLFTAYSESSVGSFSTGTVLLSHRQSLSPSLSGELVANFSRSRSLAGSDDELFPRLTLSYAGQGYTASVVTETRWDLDGDRFIGDAQYTLERLPEVTVSFTPFRLGSTSLVGQIHGGVGRFRETTVGLGGRSLDAARGDLLATLTGPVRVGERDTLGMRLFARTSIYSTGNLRQLYGGQLQYFQPLGSGLEARLGYTGQMIAGQSPYVFDQITGALSIADAQITFRTSQLVLRANGLYDFQARQIGNILTEMTYVPRPGWAIALAASYNPVAARLDRVEANLDLQLTKDWRLQYFGFYDGGAQRIVHDRVTLTRVFCECLALSLTYLGARNEIWLEAWLTAIPWGRGRIGVGGQGNLLFDQPVPFITGP